MIKKIICLLVVVLFCVGICGCAGVPMEEQTIDTQTSIFVKLETLNLPNGGYGYIIYHKTTKVMYIMSYEGVATIMVNAEGKPLLWKG